MQVFSQALSVLATVLLLAQLSVHALAIPIDTRIEATSDLKKSHGGHYDHKDGHHKPAPVEDAFVHYGRSTQPTPSLEEPYRGHIVDDAFVGYTREQNKDSDLNDIHPDAKHVMHLVEKAFFGYGQDR